MSAPRLTDDAVGEIIFRLLEESINATRDEVREVEEALSKHGTDGGGNRLGLLGTCIAMEIEKEWLKR